MTIRGTAARACLSIRDQNESHHLKRRRPVRCHPVSAHTTTIWYQYRILFLIRRVLSSL